MGLLTGWSEGRETRRNLTAARRAARQAGRQVGRAAGTPGFVLQSEPRSFGDPARGRQLLAGNLLFAGDLVTLEAEDPWSLAPPSAGFDAALQGFGWLDDLAALGGLAARALAQRWLKGWIATHGGADGSPRATPWQPDLAGRRLIRWVHHGPFLLAGPGRAGAEAFFAAAATHARFLAERWPAAAPGLPRFEALTGLLYAGLSLQAMEALVDPARAGLARDCAGLIDTTGALPSRNPQELLEVLSLLTWCAAMLETAGQPPEPAIGDAIARIVPTLKTLRHADGSLARFHGGEAAGEGALDLALAESGVRARPRPGQAMGFLRLSARRTTVIVDAAPPPAGPDGHASTLAFELTSARRPVIVSCGPGAAFGPEWRRAARGTAAHSTLVLAGWSSSRLSAAARIALPEAAEPVLAERPAQVTLAREGEGHAAGAVLSHDGWARSHGLVHIRRLELATDGRALRGEDALMALTTAQRNRFEAVAEMAGPEGLPFRIAFHLHPEVSARLDMSGRAVSLTLRSGEVWVLRAEGALPALEPSVYLQPGRLRPRPCWQVVLAGHASGPAVQIGWTLAKAQDSPVGLRDLRVAEIAGA